jgi:signal peptidase I
MHQDRGRRLIVAPRSPSDPVVTVLPTFSAGDRVFVKDETPPYHHRTPWYIKGRHGVVVEFIGTWVNSETRAHGSDGLPELPMYRVEFDQADLWTGYKESPTDKLWIDLYEHWLIPA